MPAQPIRSLHPLLALLFVMLPACSGESSAPSSASSGSGGPPVQGECLSCSPPSNQGPLKNPALVETSGVTASADHNDVFYAHNDSGDSSRFFAFARDGADLGTFNVGGAKNDDWEDIGQGPCLQGSCLFIADIGDSLLDRASYAVYRVAEPAMVAPGDQTVPSEKIEFVYEDGLHDAEALLVHPITGVLTIITKESDGPSSIYELPVPLSAGTMFIAVKVGEVTPPLGDNKITGGAVHPSALGALLRTHSNLFYYPMNEGQSAAEALAFSPCSVVVADEKQGEAVTFTADGKEILTVGEGIGAIVAISSCQ